MYLIAINLKLFSQLDGWIDVVGAFITESETPEGTCWQLYQAA